MNYFAKEHTQNGVIRCIHRYIDDNGMAAGDRLPSERKMSDIFNVSRQLVRQAIKKLEIYGIVKTHPQRRSVIENFTRLQLHSVVLNTMSDKDFDFCSLVNVRVLLEKESLRLCCINRTEEDLRQIEEALRISEMPDNLNNRVNIDLNYHVAISKGAHNSVITFLLQAIIPDIMAIYRKLNLCDAPEDEVITVHREMYDIIRKGEPDKAYEIVEKHLFRQIQNSKHFIKELKPSL